MIHPILMRYAELAYPAGGFEQHKTIAESALADILQSFEESHVIDYITWATMVKALDHPGIGEEDFMDVYEHGWNEYSLLYKIVQEMLKPVDFSDKILEDYL